MLTLRQGSAPSIYSYAQNNPLHNSDPSGAVTFFGTEVVVGWGPGDTYSVNQMFWGMTSWLLWTNALRATATQVISYTSAVAYDATPVVALAMPSKIATAPCESRGSCGLIFAVEEGLLEGATPEGLSKPGMGADKYGKLGGAEQAEKDFEEAAKGAAVAQPKPGVKVATLPGGVVIIIRPSSEGSPTIEVQRPGGNPIKIRYR